MKFDPSLTDTLDLDEDDVLPPLGRRSEILRAVLAVAPDADVIDPSRPRVVLDAASITMGVGDSDPVDGVMLAVRGGGDEVVETVCALASAMGGRPWDTSTGKFLDRRGAENGLADWKRYRDRVVALGEDGQLPG